MSRADAFWASAVQWARVGIGGAVFLVAARSLPIEAVGAFGLAAAPMRMLQVLHKGGVEDAAVVTDPADKAGLAALQRLSLMAGLAAAGLTLAAAAVMARVAPGTGVGLLAAALAPVPVAHGIGAVADGMLRRAGRFRALALRTLVGQGAAAALGLSALALGAGVWALVIFSLAQAAGAALLSVGMAGWPGARGRVRPALALVTPLAGRVLVGALVQPVLQVAIGAAAGLGAAGVWQIAVRVVAMLEAVTIVPLRFVALPRLAAGGVAEVPVLLAAAGLAGVWVMGGTALAAPVMVSAVLGEAGAPVVPVLRVLCLGAVAGGGLAVLNQALIGTGRGRMALGIAVAGGAAALVAGGVALLLAPVEAAALWLAVAQVAAGILPLALALRAAGGGWRRLGAMLRPWAGLGVMVPAVWLAGRAMTDHAAMAVLAAQAVAGTLALAAVLPVLAPRLAGRGGR